MNSSISLQNVYVHGINTMKRNVSLKQWLFHGVAIDYAKINILQDINFKAKSGDRIGILGTNGSGKSSLLKVIANIYPHSSGKLEVNGKITAALETGVGFDHSLNAKDNIKLSFIYNNNCHHYNDEIVDTIMQFAELEDYDSIPLCTYSSGMLARLAFTATCFQMKYCNILLLDEVLATGDISFIHKADKMLKQTWNDVEIAITVSHNIEEISALCTTCYIMQNGSIVNYGTTQSMIKEYKMLYDKNY